MEETGNRNGEAQTRPPVPVTRPERERGRARPTSDGEARGNGRPPSPGRHVLNPGAQSGRNKGRRKTRLAGPEFIERECRRVNTRRRGLAGPAVTRDDGTAHGAGSPSRGESGPRALHPSGRVKQTSTKLKEKWMDPRIRLGVGVNRSD